MWTNDVFLATFQLTSEETVGSTLAMLAERQFADPVLRERMEAVFASSLVLRGYELRLQTATGDERVFRVGASQIPVSTEMPLALVVVEPAPRAGSGAKS